MKIIVGLFIVLHGLVHLLYAGQSLRLFELQEGMLWPDGSWAFSKMLGPQALRNLAGIACVLAALGFVLGGVGIFLEGAWWRQLVVGSAAFSAAIFALFWNGRLQRLDNQGGIGILIDLAILTAVLVLNWPNFDF